MNKKKASQLLIAVMASAFVLTPVGSSIEVFAASNNHIENSIDTTSYTPSVSELQDLGLSDDEIQALLSVKTTGIYLINGVAYDKDGNKLTVIERGKLTWAVKALRAAWDKIPANVKAAIGGVAGFETLLSVIDNFTGAIEDAVYAGCQALGMSDTVAWWVTKSLMLFL